MRDYPKTILVETIGKNHLDFENINYKEAYIWAVVDNNIRTLQIFRLKREKVYAFIDTIGRTDYGGGYDFYPCPKEAVKAYLNHDIGVQVAFDEKEATLRIAEALNRITQKVRPQAESEEHYKNWRTSQATIRSLEETIKKLQGE
jgi:hypothetical protein